MFETGRRSAISSSELGLYSDRADGYNRSKYGSVVRKFVIVVMAIVAVILAAIFIYDFAAGASSSSKVSQETKHIYILQNALRKPNHFSKKLTTTLAPPKPEVDQLTSAGVQDRSDDDVQDMTFIDIPHAEAQQGHNINDDVPEVRSQNLENFQLKKRLVESQEKDDGDGEVEGKQSISNHAVVYRVRQMYQHPYSTGESPEESRPTPFHFELNSPHPESFKRPKFPQLTQYRYPQSSKNIQDIIKYLTKDPEGPKRGIKFTGVYMNPKKNNLYPDMGEMMANSDRIEMSSGLEDTEEDEMESSHMSISHNDPLYPYKPKHPADVNLLAPANVRFSPSVLHRYHPYSDTYFQRPMMTRPPASFEQSYDNAGAYSANFGKKKKPKPFSVMLDIYPITDLNQSTNKKISRPRPQSSSEEYMDPRRPSASFGRGGWLHSGSHAASSQAIPVVAIPANQPGSFDEDEKQQMVFHLNLYPRKKNGLSRNDILQRSESTNPGDEENFFKKVMLPFDTITKQLTDHSAIEEAKLEDSDTLALTRYEENSLDMESKKALDQNLEIKRSNSVHDEKVPSMEKSFEDSENLGSEAKENEKKIGAYTTEDFQKFADGLVAVD